MAYSLTTGSVARDGMLDMSMRDPADWRAPPYPMAGRHFGALFFGDDACGPFAALNSVDPQDVRYAPAPGHGHRSDSWRVSVMGSLRVGAQYYEAGGFRFQEAGLLYGADDVGWSPDGAQSVVMMADRRGATAIPANAADTPRFAAAAAGFDAWLGRGERIEAPVIAGVATTFGAPRFGRVDGSFAKADGWRERAPGVRLELGLCGDRICGPVVLLTAAKPRAVAFPPLTLPTEVMHVVVGGSACADGRTIAAADVRLVEGGAVGPALTATDRLWLASVIGDRRALTAARCTDTRWLEEVRSAVATLMQHWAGTNAPLPPA